MPSIVFGTPQELFQHYHGDQPRLAHTALGSGSAPCRVVGTAGLRLERGGAGAQVFSYYKFPFRIDAERGTENRTLRLDARLKVDGHASVLAGRRDATQGWAPENQLMAWATFSIRAEVDVEEEVSGARVIRALTLESKPWFASTTVWDHSQIEGYPLVNETRQRTGQVTPGVKYVVNVYVDLKISGYCFTDTADPAKLPHVQWPEARVNTAWAEPDGLSADLTLV